MKFPTKGRIILWTPFAVAIYVVLGFADVVPLSGSLKGAIVIFGKYALWTLAIVIGLLVLVVIGRSQSIDSRLSKAKRAGDRKQFLRVLRSAPMDHGLKLAAEYGETDIVRDMIDKGARPDGYPMPGDHCQGDSPLIAAERVGSDEIVHMLVTAGADVNREGGLTRALNLAILGNHPGIVKLLIDRGARPDECPAPGDHGVSDFPLMAAAYIGSEEIVRILIAAGADVNRKDRLADYDDEMCALDVAIAENHSGIVKLLLQHGADAILDLSGAISRGDVEFLGDVEFVRLLLDHGADPTPALPGAISHGDVEVVSLLLERGAAPTPALPGAISGGHADIVKLLLQHGADIDVLKHCKWRDPDQSAGLLARIGEHRQAYDIIKATVGVELPAAAELLLQCSEKFGSLFVALAERYESEGDYVSAKRLWEWKLSRGNSLLDTSAWLHILAHAAERQGNVEEALRLYRDALSRWQLDTRLEVFESMEANELLPTELRALLRDCERIFARLGKSEERDRVVVALKRLGGVES